MRESDREGISKRIYVALQPGDQEAVRITKRSLQWGNQSLIVVRCVEEAESLASVGDLFFTLEPGDVLHPSFSASLLAFSERCQPGDHIRVKSRQIDQDQLLSQESRERGLWVAVLPRANISTQLECSAAKVSLRQKRKPDARLRSTFRRAVFANEPESPEPSLAIIIPARNMKRYISETLESIELQTCPPDEVVVVDDGSSDETGLLARQSNVVTSVITGPERGLAAARTVGVSKSRSELLMFLDADDCIEPDWVARAKGLARRWTAGEIFVGLRQAVDDDGTPLGASKECVHAWDPRSLACWNAFGSCSGVVLRRATLTMVGGFDDKVLFAEDWDLWQRLSQCATVIEALVPSARTRHREGSMLRDRNFEWQLEWMRRVTAHAHPLDVNVAEASVLATVATRAVAAGDLVCARTMFWNSFLLHPKVAWDHFSLLCALSFPQKTSKWLQEQRRKWRRTLGQASDCIRNEPFSFM